MRKCNIWCRKNTESSIQRSSYGCNTSIYLGGQGSNLLSYQCCESVFCSSDLWRLSVFYLYDYRHTNSEVNRSFNSRYKHSLWRTNCGDCWHCNISFLYWISVRGVGRVKCWLWSLQLVVGERVTSWWCVHRSMSALSTPGGGGTTAQSKPASGKQKYQKLDINSLYCANRVSTTPKTYGFCVKLAAKNNWWKRQYRYIAPCLSHR